VLVSFGHAFGGTNGTDQDLGSDSGGGGHDFPAVADADGNWEVEFNGGGVGNGPGTCTVTGEEGPAIVAKNVMAGDVYFCRSVPFDIHGIFLACTTHLLSRPPAHLRTAHLAPP
jgi:hypothetical protein